MKKKYKVIILILSLLVLLLAGFVVYLLFFDDGNWRFESWLQEPEQIVLMERGILHNNLNFIDGKDVELVYDFENKEYIKLKEEYDLQSIAGNGSEFEKTKNLMNRFSGRLTHQGNYDNHIPMNALDLLEYSLDNKKHGINCRAKAQILNEMCLSLGIYSRKVWILPYSVYDNECHVVNEIWDSNMNKWIMFDITNNTYWINENKEPLSVIEIRNCIESGTFCTPVAAMDDLKDIERSFRNNYDIFIYIAKNIAYMRYCEVNTVGESEEKWYLCSCSVDVGEANIISEQSIIKSPVNK